MRLYKSTSGVFFVYIRNFVWILMLVADHLLDVYVLLILVVDWRARHFW